MEPRAQDAKRAIKTYRLPKNPFAFSEQLWYGSGMLQAFVGIMSPKGIENFYPEDPTTVHFLWRRVERQKGRVTCFWSVLPSEAAVVIEAAVALGWNQEALCMLQQHSREYGRIVPFRDDAPCSRSHRQLG